MDRILKSLKKPILRVRIIKKPKYATWWYFKDKYVGKVYDVYYDKDQSRFCLVQTPFNDLYFSDSPAINNYTFLYIEESHAVILDSSNKGLKTLLTPHLKGLL